MTIYEEKDLKGELTQEPEPEEEFRMAIYEVALRLQVEVSLVAVHLTAAHVVKTTKATKSKQTQHRVNNDNKG